MKIIFVTEINPFPPLGGDCLRAFNLLKALKSFSEVHLVIIDYGCSYDKEAIDAQAAAVVKSIAYIDIPKKPGNGLVERVRPRQDILAQLRSVASSANPDVAFLEYGYIAHYAQAFPECKIIFDTQNVQSDIDLQIAKLPTINLPRQVYAGLVWKASQYHEQKYLPRCDSVLAVSEIDLAHYKRQIPLTKLQLVPNFIELSRYVHKGAPIKSTESPHIVFTGSMDAFQNQQAGDYLLENIWPRVLQDLPDCQLLMVGKNPPQRWINSHHPNVHITGTVPTTVPFIKAADVAIVPVLHGSGTRYKILEAMACGTPVVSTSLGCQGLNVTNGVNILIEDKADQFAKGLVDLLTSPHRQAAFAERGYRLVEEQYSLESTSLVLQNLCKKLLASVDRPAAEICC